MKDKARTVCSSYLPIITQRSYINAEGGQAFGDIILTFINLFYYHP